MAKSQEPLTESYFYILLCLYNKPHHGYGIMSDTEKITSGRVKIGAGTMYGAFNNLVKKAWIKEHYNVNYSDDRRKLYEITEKGKIVIENEVERLKELLINAKYCMNSEEENIKNNILY